MRRTPRFPATKTWVPWRHCEALRGGRAGTYGARRYLRQPTRLPIPGRATVDIGKPGRCVASVTALCESICLASPAGAAPAGRNENGRRFRAGLARIEVSRRRATVDEQACRLQSSLRDAVFLAGADPALKCRAILRDRYTTLLRSAWSRIRALNRCFCRTPTVAQARSPLSLSAG